jgi:uncharacterized protein (DUF697 family)
MGDGRNSDERSTWLLDKVHAIAISPADAKAIVRRLRAQSEGERPRTSEREQQERVADHIVSRYARMCATVGGTSALSGVVPGLGTIIAAVGGAAADAVVCMKFQVDMCMCLAEAFGYDVTEPDAQHLAFLVAAGGALEKAGEQAGVKLASKAGVSLVKQYLKGAALQTIKELFKKLGIMFTRKALEKALPFGIGVAFGAGGNYALTRYVGAQAKHWFVLDRDERTRA